MKPARKIRYILVLITIAFFAFSSLLIAFAPWFMLKEKECEKISDLVKETPLDFIDLKERHPKEFKKYLAPTTKTLVRGLGEPDLKAYNDALLEGKEIYIREGCWYCHSQFVRNIPSDKTRWGKASDILEYQNELNKPHLVGTRRVGPDLIREGSKRSNDWHIAHFENPSSVVPYSIMPRFRWFFDENGKPNKKCLAIVTYIQWLGSQTKPR